MAVFPYPCPNPEDDLDLAHFCHLMWGCNCIYKAPDPHTHTYKKWDYNKTSYSWIHWHTVSWNYVATECATMRFDIPCINEMIELKHLVTHIGNRKTILVEILDLFNWWEDSPWFSTLGKQLSHDINMIKPWKKPCSATLFKIASNNPRYLSIRQNERTSVPSSFCYMNIPHHWEINKC